MITDITLMVVAFFGLLIGIIIGRNTYEELKTGNKYFILAKNLILIIISLLFIFSIKSFSLAYLILFFIGFLIFHFLKFNYLSLGLAAVMSILINQQLMVLPLIFIYGLPFGSLRYYHIKNHQKLIRIILINLLLFLVPLTILFFEFETYAMLAFAAGALISNVR